MSWLPRAMGAATAAYSVAIMIKPEILAKPCKLLDPAGRVPKQVRTLVVSIGARDLVSGLALALAPDGRAQRVALAARVATDLGDAVFLTAGVPKEARPKVAGVAGGWAALTALTGLATRR